jgi:hypothetical protein
VRADVVKYPEQYPWSSYPGYYYGRMPLSWLNYERVLAEFGEGREARERYREFVAEGIRRKLAPPWARAVGGWLLGSPKFVAKTYAILAKDAKGGRWDSRASQGKRAIDATLDEIAQAVCKEFSITPEQLKSRDARFRAARRAFALLAREHAGHSWQSIAGCLGARDRNAALQMERRARARRINDAGFRKRIDNLEAQIR